MRVIIGEKIVDIPNEDLEKELEILKEVPTHIMEIVNPKFVEPIPTVKVPTYIMDEINMLEKLSIDYKTKTEKLRKEVQNIKEQYGIK